MFEIGKPTVLKCKCWKSLFFENQGMFWRKHCAVLLNSFLIQIQIRIPKSEILIFYHLQGWLPTFLILQNFWINISFHLNSNIHIRTLCGSLQQQETESGSQQECLRCSHWGSGAIIASRLREVTQTISDISPNITEKDSELPEKNRF